MEIITKIFKNNFLLFLILIMAVILRFYRLSEMASLDFDQEYASNFAYRVLREFPIQMIGQGLSVQGLFMGPWYFYFLVPLRAAFSSRIIFNSSSNIFSSSSKAISSFLGETNLRPNPKPIPQPQPRLIPAPQGPIPRPVPGP